MDGNIQNSKACLLILCGLPGSGKTTIAGQIKDAICENWKESKTFHVCYDYLFPVHLERKVIENYSGFSADSPGDLLKWKQYRKHILNLVMEGLGKSTLANMAMHGDGLSFKPECLHSVEGCERKQIHKSVLQKDDGCSPEDSSIRTRFYESVLKNVESRVKGESRLTSNNIAVTSNASETKDIINVWIIDDNMYYRSMRYEYYQMARQFEVGFATVYLECTAEQALAQNSSRSNPVDDDVILTMDSKLEPPDPQSGWESNYLTINTQHGLVDLDEVMNLIQKSVDHPVKPIIVEDLEMKVESQKTCSKNTLHQADQILRKLIAAHMVYLKANGFPKADLQSKGKMMNIFKMEILDNIRRGTVPLLNNYTEEVDASKNEDSFLYKTIQHIFEQVVTS